MKGPQLGIVFAIVATPNIRSKKQVRSVCVDMSSMRETGAIFSSTQTNLRTLSPSCS